MNVLQSWMQTPALLHLGWAIVHSLWQGALVAAALAAVLAATRSPRLRYAAACAALFIMPVAFWITLLLRQSVDVDRRPPLPERYLFSEMPAAGSGAFSQALNYDLAAPYVAALWLAGVCLASGWQLAGWCALRRLRRIGVFPAPEHWMQELHRLSNLAGVSRPVALLESFLAGTPSVFGHFRPVILMPIGVLSGLPASQIEAILLHELAHIRRGDYLVNLVQRFVDCVFFYHPAAWWISRVIRDERENCCDDMAVALTGGAREYAAALAALESTRVAGTEPALAATGGSLMKRVRRLLHPAQSTVSQWPVAAAAILTMIGALSLAAWQFPGQKNAQELSGPYKKWLQEDVVYIISEEERSAFERLTTNDEREEFIQQFWSRRDTTPATLENEFKEEHYRRIAYSNELYAESKPGWRTERGRIYIQWGPPDEIEAHPSGRNGGPPFQIWLYRRLKAGGGGFITFIDRDKNGIYQIAPGPPK